MFCSNCGAKIEDGSRFCAACGKSLATEIQAPVEPEEKVTKPQEKKEKKPNKKTVKLISIISGSLVLLILLFYAIPTLFIPWGKISKAKSLSKKGDYIEAYEMIASISTNAYGLLNIYSKEREYVKKVFDSLVEEEKYEEAYNFAKGKFALYELYDDNDDITSFLMNIINEYIKSCDADKAMQLCADNYSDLSSTIRSTLPEQIAEADRENLYNSVVKVLDNEKLWETMEQEHISSGSISVLSYMLSALPNDYNNAGNLKLLCDGIANSFGGSEAKYIYDNRYLITAFWELDSIRSLVTDNYNIDAYLDGTWKNSETGEFLSFDSSPYASYNNIFSTNLNVPQVTYRYYDIKNMMFIYCNEGSSKVCDVFKLELDPANPYKLNVYCYADGKNVTLIRTLTN